MKSDSYKYSGLGYYIREVLFKEYAEDREPLEVKWEKNRNAFTAVSEGVWKKDEGDDWRSNTFIQTTKQKVLAAYAMVIDMLLQGGKFPFALKPSPLDEVELEELPDEQREIVEDDLDDMTQLIHQQLQWCHADRQLMKNVMSGAIFGETIAEEYVHQVERKGYRKVSLAPPGTPNAEQYDRFEPYSKQKEAPAYKYCSLWNFFRDMESEDLQAGSGVIYREMTCPYDLDKMKGQPFVLDDKIDAAIKSATPPGGSEHGGADTHTLPPALRDIKHRRKTIEKLKFWGRVPVSLVEDFEKNELSNRGDSFDIISDYEYDGKEVEVMVVMADCEVVQYAINDIGKRPYYRVVWEDKLDHADATGVADNVQDVQQVLNGMVRAFEDNVKLAANVILALKKRYLAPGAMKDGIKPGMELEIAEECDDARKAIQQVIIQDITGSLINGIPLFERYADEGSQIPKILQGVVAEKHKPDTLGELNMLQQNSGKYLGSVIKNFDEGLIEPVTMSFYEYNMEDPEVTKGKGNFIAEALGFTSFQDRVMRMQKLMQGLNLVLSSDVLSAEVKPREIMTDLWKALDLDPTTVFKTPAKEQLEFQEWQAEKARQLENEAKTDDVQAKIAEEGAKHKFGMEEKKQEHEFDMIEADQKFQHDLVLKAVDGGRKNESQKVS